MERDASVSLLCTCRIQLRSRNKHLCSYLITSQLSSRLLSVSQRTMGFLAPSQWRERGRTDTRGCNSYYPSAPRAVILSLTRRHVPAVTDVSVCLFPFCNCFHSLLHTWLALFKILPINWIYSSFLLVLPLFKAKIQSTDT